MAHDDPSMQVDTTNDENAPPVATQVLTQEPESAATAFEARSRRVIVSKNPRGKKRAKVVDPDASDTPDAKHDAVAVEVKGVTTPLGAETIQWEGQPTTKALDFVPGQSTITNMIASRSEDNKKLELVVHHTNADEEASKGPVFRLLLGSSNRRQCYIAGVLTDANFANTYRMSIGLIGAEHKQTRALITKLAEAWGNKPPPFLNERVGKNKAVLYLQIGVSNRTKLLKAMDKTDIDTTTKMDLAELMGQHENMQCKVTLRLKNVTLGFDKIEARPVAYINWEAIEIVVINHLMHGVPAWTPRTAPAKTLPAPHTSMKQVVPVAATAASSGAADMDVEAQND